MASALQVAAHIVFKKFHFITKILGVNATVIFREVTGLDDGNYYGRYNASGNPLTPFNEAFKSIEDMITRGAILRETLRKSLVAGDAIAIEGDVKGDLGEAILKVISDLSDCAANPLDAIDTLIILAAFTAPKLTNAGNDQYAL